MSEEKVCTFFKKRRNVQLRKTDNDRVSDEESTKKSKTNDNDHRSDSEPEENNIDNDNSDTDLTENLNEIKKKFKSKGSHLSQSTKKVNADESKKSDETLSTDIFTTFSANKSANR